MKSNFDSDGNAAVLDEQQLAAVQGGLSLLQAPDPKLVERVRRLIEDFRDGRLDIPDPRIPYSPRWPRL